ncbi:MAG TPA: choice-of-anchor tandem repeat GloVer-containing protein [Candidatus Sulfotelmatobacter sp.]|nr:choice-of-anchor tandem repeat GloVer-containing protein [Candidatus Sulfotelmatobacter sp.]
MWIPKLTNSILRATLVLTFALLAGMVANMQGQSTFKLLHGFVGGTDGAHPTSGVSFGPKGYLYGVTIGGGAYNWGTVFSIGPGGRYKVVYTFTGGADEGFPNNQLTWVGTTLFGVTSAAGAYSQGTIFEIDTTTGIEKTLYTFTGLADGGSPDCALVPDNVGNLYGTTFYGGANGGGTIFRFAPSNGNLTTLYAFKGGTDGQYPFGRMARDASGNLYGATIEGGANNFGTIFGLSQSGVEKVLYTFLGWPVLDLYYPYADLIRDSAGNLYGGGTSGGLGNGAIFKVSAAGEETIYNVPSGTAGPSHGVVTDSAGNFYGTLAADGNYGGVFKMDTSGNYTILYTFTGGVDGASPEGADVIRDAQGNLYGTTDSGGGQKKYGTVFELTFP